MLRLDYVSCLLTVASTVLIGQRKWQGWIVAGLNSGIICVIGIRTAQIGFIPANLFCLAIYSYNIFQWRRAAEEVSNNSNQKDERLLIRFAHPALKSLGWSKERGSQALTAGEPVFQTGPLPARLASQAQATHAPRRFMRRWVRNIAGDERFSGNRTRQRPLPRQR
jgi:hypothetical protein